MVVMYVILAAVLAAVVAAGAAGATYVLLQRRAEAAGPSPAELGELGDVVYEAIDAAMAEMAQRSGAERDAAVRAALEQSAVLSREQLGTATNAASMAS